MVKYHLGQNYLTDKEDDFMAHAQSAGTFDKEALIKRMLDGGTLLTRTDCLAVLNRLEETIIAILQEGHTVSLPLFHISFSISGVFNGAMDTFDHTRHTLHININIGNLLRNVQENIKLVKTEMLPPALCIMEVKDSVSGSVNGTLTAKGVLEIYGNHIKIGGSNPACGLYFVNSAGKETKAVTIVQNKPSTVIAMIPALTAGVYHVKIVTQYNGHMEIKRAREYSFDHELTVK